MGAETKIKVTDNVHSRLSAAREQFHATDIKKSGWNDFSKYSYFELADFLIPALGIFRHVGLNAVVSFGETLARMDVVNIDNPSEIITITSPMGSAKLKACHEVQNIGAVETYQRRYLWGAALEIVEHDAVDASKGAEGQSQNGAVSPPRSDEMPDHEWSKMVQLVEASNANVPAMLKLLSIVVPDNNLKLLNQEQYGRVIDALEFKLKKMANDATNAKANVAA